jgi:DNA-directed RNA polymerase specialized sigma24 family protein
VLIEVLGYDYREAGAILQVPVGTLKSRMHRARAALMRRLSEDEEAAGEM